MKKIVVLLLAGLLMLTFSACVESERKDSSDNESTTQTETQSKDQESSNVTESEEEETDESEVVDTAALAKIEQADDFAIKIKAAKAVEGLFDNGSTVIDLNGEDGVLLTIENSLDITVNEFAVLILCTDENGKGCDLGTLNLTSPSTAIIDGQVVSYSDYVKFMGTSEADLAPNNSKEFSLQCDLGKIKNVNAIIYSYTDADGNEIVNENYVDWMKNTVDIKVY